MKLLLLISLFLLDCEKLFSFQLKGLNVIRASDSNVIDLESVIRSKSDKTILIVGTYAADFNNIEYAQRLKYYLPQLKEKGVKNFLFIMNAQPAAAKALANILNLQNEIELYCDKTGSVGKSLGKQLQS